MRDAVFKLASFPSLHLFWLHEGQWCGPGNEANAIFIAVVGCVSIQA